MLAKGAIQEILDIQGPISTKPGDLAEELRVTRYPDDKQDPSAREAAFADRLVDAFDELGAEVVPYEETLTSLDLDTAFKWLKRGVQRTLAAPFEALTDGQTSFEQAKRPPLRALADASFGDRIEPGTVVVAAGEGETGNLPVDAVADFQDITILTAIDRPDDVEADMPFPEHYEAALELFARYMTNVVVGVDDDEWFLYNFNGSHPFYSRELDLVDKVGASLVPKLAAPIRPPRLEQFEVREEAFDPTDTAHAPIVEEMVRSANVLDDSGLYPPGKDLDELPWRNAFYRWAGKLHLDDRSGMSYGFLARQMPTQLVPAREVDAVADAPAPGRVERVDGRLRATLEAPQGPRVLEVPPVEVMTLRSGCDKTDPDPEHDLVKLGLEAGRMVMSTPEGTVVEDGYRPSFDSRVILAHAVGNALVASILEDASPGHRFAEHLAEEGMALAHWHGYPNPEHLPEGWQVHGADKPPVSCGTPHAGLFALQGKLEAVERALAQGEGFQGDAHIEPQHGTNLTHRTLDELASFLTRDEDVAGLGNRYLDAYTSEAARPLAR